MVRHSKDKTVATEASDPRLAQALLCEVSWEVCNQLGGIYTVVRSKVPSMVAAWDDRYCLVGPYNPQSAQVEFEACPPEGPFGRAVLALTAAGIEAYYGRWLVTGHPQAVLINPASVAARLPDIKRGIWESERIDMLASDPLVDQVVAFGDCVAQWVAAVAREAGPARPLIAQFHEWMAGTPIFRLRREGVPVATLFTTHATQLGRYLAMDDNEYYDHLAACDWMAAARRYNLLPKAHLERQAAQRAHVLTTVSAITGAECEHLLGRRPDVLTPNGLNIERFVALHEFQNLHRRYKEKIHEFVMGHFFPSYTFDLDQTLYVAISGRYEFGNKGFDLAIEAMSRLNWRLRQARALQRVVFFIVTKSALRSVNAEVLKSRALMEEIRGNCNAIQEQIGTRLFEAVARGQWPQFEDLVDEYWQLRLRRGVQAWRTRRMPPVVTHDLAYEESDAILTKIRAAHLLNSEEDPVKVVYHPDFVTPSEPLLRMDYDQFIRGCHLGIFPSLYEPWGYAPLECVALGIPTVTSDLTGFGTYVQEHVADHTRRGIWVLPRRHVSFDAAAAQLADWCYEFVRLNRRERIAMRNAVESVSEQFDWRVLGRHYAEAQQRALASAFA